MLKRSLKIFIFLAIFILLTGCKSSKMVKFNVSNGEVINVTLDTTNGYDISSEIPFYVIKDAKKMCQGEFIVIDSYDQALIELKSNSEVKILDKGARDDGDYIFYSYNDSSWGYIIKLKKSSTSIYLSSTESKDNVSKCASLLTFEKQN